jgi:hypothetical protein
MIPTFGTGKFAGEGALQDGKPEPKTVLLQAQSAGPLHSSPNPFTRSLHRRARAPHHPNNRRICTAAEASVDNEQRAFDLEG